MYEIEGAVPSTCIYTLESSRPKGYIVIISGKSAVHEQRRHGLTCLGSAKKPSAGSDPSAVLEGVALFAV